MQLEVPSAWPSHCATNFRNVMSLCFMTMQKACVTVSPVPPPYSFLEGVFCEIEKSKGQGGEERCESFPCFVPTVSESLAVAEAKPRVRLCEGLREQL